MHSYFLIIFFSERAEQQKIQFKQDAREAEEKFSHLTKAYEKLKLLIEQKEYSRARRKNTATTFETILNPHSSTKYRRRQETKNILEFIHGGEEGSLYGAWDHVVSNTSKPLMESY